jgi:ketosteroid isomerase-like protein
MKKGFEFHFTIIISLCLLTNFVFSQNKTVPFDMATANKAIQLQIRAFENDLNKGDSVALGTLYCTDAKIMNNGSPSTVGRADIINAFGEMIRDSITGSAFTTVGVWGSDEILVEEGTGYFAHANGKVVSRGRYLLIWKKEDGKWKIFRDTFFSDGKIK